MAGESSGILLSSLLVFNQAVDTELKERFQTAVMRAENLLTVGWPTAVVTGVKVESVVKGDEVIWPRDITFLHGSVETITPVHAALSQFF